MGEFNLGGPMTEAPLPNQRKSERFEPNGAIAITINGVCKVVNISSGGVALKCVADCVLPPEWAMDICDVNGACVEQLQVRKIWQRPEKTDSSTPPLFVNIGCCFQDQINSQKIELDTYLQDLSKII